MLSKIREKADINNINSPNRMSHKNDRNNDEYKNEIKRLRNDIEMLRDDNDRLRQRTQKETMRSPSRNRDSLKECDELRTQLKEKKRLIENLKFQVQQIKAEIDRLRSIDVSNPQLRNSNKKRIEVLEDENMALKSELISLKHQLNQTNVIVTQNEALKLENSSKKRRINDLMEERKSIDRRLIELEASVQYKAFNITPNNDEQLKDRDRLLSLYKQQLYDKELIINKLKLKNDRLSDENHDIKLNRIENEVKNKVSNYISDKAMLAELKTVKIKLEASETDNICLRKENEKLREFIKVYENRKEIYLLSDVNNGDREISSGYWDENQAINGANGQYRVVSVKEYERKII